MNYRIIFIVIVLVACGAFAAEEAKLIHELKPLSVRGVNYYPRDTPWSGLWTKTTPEVWEHDMALAASLGVNTIRTFIQFEPHVEQAGLMQRDGQLTSAYLDKIECLLAAAWRHQIRLIFCFEFDPRWLTAPGAAAMWKRALSVLVTAHRTDGRVLLWDLMNEPDDDAKWTVGTRAYLRDALPFIKRLDSNHRTTVGITWRINRLAECGLPNVLQYHEYCPKTELFEKGPTRVIHSIVNQRQVGGARPVLIGEFGQSTARDPQHGAEELLCGKIGNDPGTEAEQVRLYEIVLAAAQQERIAGVLPWCLHDYPINNPNESYFGLVRADGSLKPAAIRLQATFAKWREDIR